MLNDNGRLHLLTEVEEKYYVLSFAVMICLNNVAIYAVDNLAIFRFCRAIL